MCLYSNIGYFMDISLIVGIFAFFILIFHYVILYFFMSVLFLMFGLANGAYSVKLVFRIQDFGYLNVIT